MLDNLVTVIIPVFNGQSFLRQAIDSALAQTYPHVEIIAVNDGSTDSSSDILASYGSIIRVFHQRNSGQAAARNRGITEARGRWIAFLDQDDLWDSTKLQVQLSAAHSDIAVHHCNARLIDAAGKITKQAVSDSQIPATLLEFINGNCVKILTAIVARTALTTVGNLDATNRYGTDDYQLWLRLSATGHKFQYISQVLASYRLHADNTSLNRTRMAQGVVYALKDTRRNFGLAFGPKETHLYHERLFRSYFNLAWHEYDEAKYRPAARNFALALRHRPISAKTWAYFAATMLPFRNQYLPILRGLLRPLRG